MNPTLSTVPATLIDANRMQRFADAARSVAATVEIIDRSAEAIATSVARIAASAKTHIAVAEARDIPDTLFAQCRKLERVVLGRSRHDLATVGVGVTDSFGAVATTGTICVRLDASDRGYISLLARTHVAVVAPERIVERPGDLFREDCLSGQGLHEDFVFITGPSATADMGPLVRGVHGPHFLHLLVLSA